jgi:hypothetical protein
MLRNVQNIFHIIPIFVRKYCVSIYFITQYKLCLLRLINVYAFAGIIVIRMSCFYGITSCYYVTLYC